MYHIILAGGSGKRFWPLSTESKPKQFLKIIDNISLIKSTYNRICKFSSKEKIFILSPEKYLDKIKSEIDNPNFIIEPTPRNTASAIFLAAKHINKIENNSIMGIYPSDHYIKGTSNFSKCIQNIEKFIYNNNNAILTIGIQATYPSNNYGYIKTNSQSDIINKISNFIEKPDTNKAKELIKSDNILWNSGMFFFTCNTILSEIEKLVPEFKKYSDNFIKNWSKLPKISIDYSVIEKTSQGYCIKGDFDWSDVGTWQSLYDLLPKDQNDNVVKGEYDFYDSSNNFIFSPNKKIAVVGLSNIAVINLDDKTLVVDMSKSDKLKYLNNQDNNKKNN